ncbi:MAG TPA: CpsD/CapB family tyrosine-protein kinase [Candidatus Binataceae bacterium]|nr:CpsD/CapB family tyrosine-protein kinase [Candidatus Binataceae bacterium]
MNRVYEALKQTGRVRTDGLRSQPPAAADGRAWDEGAANDTWPLPRYGAGPALIAGNNLYRCANDRFQLLSARLQALAAERNRRLFAVTSALAGEGKSFVALNLAASLAQSGARVLLIDADLRTPSLHWALKLSPVQGLLSYLMQRTDFESSMQGTRLAGLTLIPAGAAAPSAPELFACPRMRELIAAARAEYARDYIVIDCPAALAAAEAQIVARMADALVMVIGANRTPRHAVARALDQLSGCEIAGLVLNRFEPSYSCKAEYA